MKPQETKAKFIQLRAERKSYGYIAKELGISKSTCTEWEREFKEQIAELSAAQLDTLYTSYSMTAEARIKNLGDTLANIDEALEQVDFSEMKPKELLDMKLKYTEALKNEYIGTGSGFAFSGKMEATEIVRALEDLLTRVQTGETSAEQANKEMSVLQNLLKAYELVEVKAKLEALEAILGGRK